MDGMSHGGIQLTCTHIPPPHQVHDSESVPWYVAAVCRAGQAGAASAHTAAAWTAGDGGQRWRAMGDLSHPPGPGRSKPGSWLACHWPACHMVWRLPQWPQHPSGRSINTKRPALHAAHLSQALAAAGDGQASQARTALGGAQPLVGAGGERCGGLESGIVDPHGQDGGSVPAGSRAAVWRGEAGELHADSNVRRGAGCWRRAAVAADTCGRTDRSSSTAPGMLNQPAGIVF